MDIRDELLIASISFDELNGLILTDVQPFHCETVWNLPVNYML